MGDADMPGPGDAAVEAVARRHGIVLLLEFGSVVSGNLHADSDRDLGVLLERADLSLEEFGSLAHDLQTLYPDREVDVAIVNRADPLFLKKIFESARLIYGPLRRFHELQIYAFKRYQDHRRFLDLERAYVRSALDRLASAR
jgi:predicted nucleotidyltransferase